MANKIGSEKKGGRKKGTPNKATAMNREMISDLLNENVERFRGQLLYLKPKDYCETILSLMKFVIPQLSNVTLDHSEKTTNTIVEILNKLGNDK